MTRIKRKVGNAISKNAIVRIHRPELTDKERAMQETKILTALQLFGKAMQEKGNKPCSRDFVKG